MQRLKSKFSSIDQFGQGINFLIKGGDTFTTSLGAVVTLLIYVTVLIYGSTKFNRLKERLDTSH